MPLPETDPELDELVVQLRHEREAHDAVVRYRLYDVIVRPRPAALLACVHRDAHLTTVKEGHLLPVQALHGDLNSKRYV